MADDGPKTLVEIVPWGSRYERAKHWAGDEKRMTTPAAHPDHPDYRATALEIEGEGYDRKTKEFRAAKITVTFTPGRRSGWCRTRCWRRS